MCPEICVPQLSQQTGAVCVLHVFVRVNTTHDVIRKKKIVNLFAAAYLVGPGWPEKLGWNCGLAAKVG